VQADFDSLDRLLSEPGHGQTSTAFNQHKQYNRYHDMPCFDSTRILLEDSLKPDYIHANYIAGYDRSKAYILTQVASSIVTKSVIRP